MFSIGVIGVAGFGMVGAAKALPVLPQEWHQAGNNTTGSSVWYRSFGARRVAIALFDANDVFMFPLFFYNGNLMLGSTPSWAQGDAVLHQSNSFSIIGGLDIHPVTDAAGVKATCLTIASHKLLISQNGNITVLP